MKIGFDAKRAVQNATGLGNYSRFVIENLCHCYPDNRYDLFCPKFTDNHKLNGIEKKNSVTMHVKEGIKPFWRTLGIVNDVKKENLDIYHGLSNELPYKINKANAKSIVTIHDLIFLKYPQFYPLLERNIYNIKARYACKVADKIIAVSECTKKDIVELYKINPDKIEVVYQGCFDIFKQKAIEEQKQEIRNRHHLPAKFLLSIGSIEERKNIVLIVKALKYLPQDIHFVAIGRHTKYTDKVIQYAKENGLENRLHIKTKVELSDLPGIIQSSEVFIYPSLYEGFGIPIIEAISSGVPVIGATGSCLEEAGGTHSIYVNPHDERELANQVKRILDNPILRTSMINNGYEYVKRFSAKSCTDRLMDVYKETLG